MRNLKPLLLSALCLVSSGLTSCSGGAAINAAPVEGLDANRYLGTWYEIARLDNGFERGLQAVTATYSKRSDDGLARTHISLHQAQHGISAG